MIFFSKYRQLGCKKNIFIQKHKIKIHLKLRNKIQKKKYSTNFLIDFIRISITHRNKIEYLENKAILML